MTPQLLLGYLTLVLAIVGGIWGVIRLLLVRDRKNMDDQQKTMWDKLDGMRTDLIEAQRELDVLKERIRAMPDQKEFQIRIEALEEKLDKKLETLAQRIQEAFVQATLHFRCPHDPG